MRVYHGRAIQIRHKGKSIERLMSGVSTVFGGLYVTEDAAKATRYANAQTTGSVSKEYHELAEGAAIIELETSEEITWRRRPASHASLDECEASINSWTVSRIIVRRTIYKNTSSNRIIDDLINLYGEIVVEIT
jgi:hypothetical protein